MALIIKTLFSAYTKAMTDWSDPRSANWFLMRTPTLFIGMLAFYIYFVLKLGPKLMEKRKPFNIDKILILYNVVQIAACVFMTYEFIRTVHNHNIWCDPLDFTSDYGAYLARQTWIYFIIKLCDLLDTVFFVLRKKQDQVTFLHVYHHTGMVVLAWVGTKFAPGGTGVFLGGYNSIVHAIMYTYYLMTVWDKKLKANLWWKKRLTQLQIVQFGLILFHFGLVLLQPNCAYPKWIPCLLVPQNLFVIILFIDFYIKTYVKTKKTEIVSPDESPKKIYKIT